MHSHDTQGPHGPPPGPRGGPVVDGDTASSLVKDLTTLFSAVEAGDTESAQTAATSVEATLTQISAASSTTDGTQDTSDTGTGFMADLKNLLIAVKGGDMQSAQTGLDTITSDVEQAHHHGGGMRMPLSDDIQQASDLISSIATQVRSRSCLACRSRPRRYAGPAAPYRR